ncbi:NusG domain II-containing protein [Tindallia californiensis]|uniref:Uncharacterized protein n=1 Tax=Tindallia californiensis TaxID=159292 RepID=A0A1H3P4I3_9FIRM|nr:NusG domain II-containing protein [Tindallia californiensis]SDY96022.1 hypothetical protein SAMN05192546_1066 [Tindallia californiensis]
MKKKDIQLLMIILIVSIIGLAGARLNASENAATSQAVIFLNDEEYVRVPLEDPQVIVIDQGDKTNEIQVTQKGVSMLYSDCSSQYCLQQGEVTLENMDQRFLGAWIYCLHNKVSIQLLRGEE